MQRQNQGASLADAQTRTHFNASVFQAFDFFQQLGHRQHHTVADIALHAWAHDAARNKVQSGCFTVDHQSVARVVAALETHHALRQLGQPIDQLAFAFIAPLRANNNHIFSARRKSNHIETFVKLKGEERFALNRVHLPSAVLQLEFAVAIEFLRFVFGARHGADYRLTGSAQLRHCCLPVGIVLPNRLYRFAQS